MIKAPRWFSFLTACLICPTAFQLTSLRADEPDDPRRPPAIDTQDVPVVPPAIFERLRRYQDMRAAAFSGWSPDGKGMLIQTRFGNAVQVHRVYEPGGRREQWTFLDEPVLGRFLPETRDQAVLLTMSRGGNENDQVYLLDRAAFRTTMLTDGKSRNLLGPVRHDGQKMIIHNNRRNGRDTDVYLADCRQPDSMQLLMETTGEFWTATSWSRDGSKLLMRHYVSINESYPALFDIASKTLKPLPLPPTEKGAKTSVGNMIFAPDGKSAYIACDARSEFLELARLDLETLNYTWLSQDIPWNVSDVEVDPKSGRVVFAVNEDGASAVYLLDGAKRRKLDLPLGITEHFEFSPDGEQLGFTLARANAPADAYSIRIKDGELIRWTYSETGGLNPATFVEPKRIAFKTFDDRQIPAFYYQSKQASPQKKAAVLIQIHGGPESQYRPLFSGITQFYVNELGIAVICPNVRGSAGYGKTYLKLDNAQLREDSVKDIGSLLDWIAQQPELDSSRVAVTGASYGGYMVLASLVHFENRLKAGIDIVGIANWITFLQQTSPYRQDLRRAEYGDERDPAMRKVFERISPSARADKIRSALLVAHGRNDPRVPFSEAQQIAEKVRSAGRGVWTVYADNEGHGFLKKDNRDYLTAVEALFLEKHLKSAP
jgi:dipeptidyl aminopeptidase/acylaminoacyl peptidase